MIDTKVLQSASAIAGFGFVNREYGKLDIASGQSLIDGSFLSFTFTVPRKDPDTVIEVLFQLIGPTQDGFVLRTHDINKWKRGDGGGIAWYNVDNTNMDIQAYVLSYTTGFVKLGVQFYNHSGGTVTYNTAVTMNAKVDFFKYPWG